MLHIITRVSRYAHFEILVTEMEEFLEKYAAFRWILIVDNSKVSYEKILSLLNKHRLSGQAVIQNVTKDSDDTYMHGRMSLTASTLPDKDWVYFLDDDNLFNEEFFHIRFKEVEEDVIVVNQKYGVNQERFALPVFMRQGSVDIGQCFFRAKLFKEYTIGKEYVGDSAFIERLYIALVPFAFRGDLVSFYNAIKIEEKKLEIVKSEKTVKALIPYILCVDFDKELTNILTSHYPEFAEQELNIKYIKSSDSEILDEVSKCDLIVTPKENRPEVLLKLPLTFRKKWIELSDTLNAGTTAYWSFMENVLSNGDKAELVSFFTSTYKTNHEALSNLCNSIKNQTYDNWEWVIVDDSPDDSLVGLLNSFTENEIRIHVYRFEKKSQGVIGDAKYKAAMLTTGEILVEIDHDDILNPFCASLLFHAYRNFPEAGFYYSDCAEITPEHESLMYPEGWAYGFGGYKEERYFGKFYKVAKTPPINPRTIRDLVSVPNHVRAWKRDIYFRIGGHNRRLNIADDFEIIVRTFLETRMVHIPLCCYFQIMHESNSQSVNRQEISRKVIAIRNHYDERISRRFKELGIEDWCKGNNFYEKEEHAYFDGMANLILQL